MKSMPYTDADLDAFLDEGLPPARMAELEAALRDDETLQKQLAAAVGRRDAGVHSLGAIWRRHRLSCPSREQLGSHLLGVLDAGEDDYLRFHLEVVECRYCQASLQDLRDQHSAAEEEVMVKRRSRYFQSSAGYLSSK
jgi:hypothetical protein